MERYGKISEHIWGKAKTTKASLPFLFPSPSFPLAYFAPYALGKN